MHTAQERVFHSIHPLRSITLESSELSLSILPEVGGKILNLVDRNSGKNLLWENPRIRPQQFDIDSNFDNYCAAGGTRLPHRGRLRV